MQPNQLNIADIASRAAQEFQKRKAPVISVDDLSNETPPVRVTQPRLDTGAVGLQASLEAGAKNFQDDYTANLERAASGARNAKDQALIDRLRNLENTKGEAELSAERYARRGGVDDLDKELRSINQQILEEQTGLQRQIESIEKAGGGLASGQNIETNRLRTESLRRQADLSIIQQGIQGRYDSAKAIADRAVAVQLERQKNLNEALRLNYEENKELFTTAEKRAFESAQADRERKLDKEEAVLKEISDLSVDALQNGMPPALFQQMRSAKTVEEAVAIGGRYVSSLIAPDGTLSPLARAVMENPELFNQLTPTDKAKIVPQLNAVGFTQFGKPLSDGAVKEITQTSTAIQGLQELRTIIGNNEQFIGPIKGLARFNPYSQARQVQADVDRVRQVVGKALEGGVLRKEDEEKYKKILATLADTPATAIYKIDALIGDLQRNVATYEAQQRSAGRNVGTGVEPANLRAKYNY